MAKRAVLRVDTEAPKTAEEANAYIPKLMSDYDALADVVKSTREQVMTLIAKAEKEAKAIAERINNRKRGLKTFAEVNRQQLSHGKTIKLPLADLFWKKSGLKVKIDNAEAAVRAIEELGLSGELLVVKKSVSKTAIKKNAEKAGNIKGISLEEGREQFYIRPHSLNHELPNVDTNVAKVILARPKA